VAIHSGLGGSEPLAETDAGGLAADDLVHSGLGRSDLGIRVANGADEN
jgi:hypothetical protein